MIVTIDGPAGAGKSSLARALAGRIDFSFLDTGALYRAVTYAALRDGWVEVGPPSQLLRTLTDRRFEQFLDRLDVHYDRGQTWLGSEDVSVTIRSPEVTSHVGLLADEVVVRERLNVIQQTVSQKVPDLVTEGRDQGTIVFPDAECKFFLTANPRVRAERRLAELPPGSTTMDELLEAQRIRDDQDAGRALAPLRPARDALVVDTSDLSFDQVLEHLVQEVDRRRSLV